jgi:hypothetical protein
LRLQAAQVSRTTESPEGLRRSLQVDCGGLAGAPVRLQLIRNLLALSESAKAGSLKRRGVNEYVLAAAGRLDEAVAALIIIPFHCALIHRMSSRYGMHV